MVHLNIENETARLKAVVVGIADNFGGIPTLEECYDPVSKEHVKSGTFPLEDSCIKAVDDLVEIFSKYDVLVYRPQNIIGLNQIFSRDIAFVIEDKLILPNIIEERRKESGALNYIFSKINKLDKIKMPNGTRAEGGDVILCNEYIFVGYSEKIDFDKFKVARTNRRGLDFIKKKFSNKKVIGFELKKSDIDPNENVLHLDCCFQPIGKGMAILNKDGFKNHADYDFLIDYFKKENIIEITRDEMCSMNSNIFSISDDVIVSEKGFFRLNRELRRRGFVVEEVHYSEIAKMSGLFRCSTMPIDRVL